MEAQMETTMPKLNNRQIAVLEPPARETVLKQLARQRLRTGAVHPHRACHVPRIARVLHHEPAPVAGDEERLPQDGWKPDLGTVGLGRRLELIPVDEPRFRT